MSWRVALYRCFGSATWRHTRRTLSTAQLISGKTSLNGLLNCCKVAKLALTSSSLDGLTEEQLQMQEEALKFARNEMSPEMRNWDKQVSEGG